jgi:squalene-associated FAD-dependent desaturase
MKKILIVGGGIAGLSSALFLSEAGYKVEVLEASPKFGGRVFSFKHNREYVDNGQHILLGCYSNTIEYIKHIGTSGLFDFSGTLSAVYVNKNSENFKLEIPSIGYPFNRLYGFLRFRLLGITERIKVITLLQKIKNESISSVKGLTVLEFLTQNNQSKNIISLFWENFVESTMNVPSGIAAAEIFVNMMRIIFFTGNDSVTTIIPKTDLNSCLVSPAIEKIKKMGGRLITSEKVKKFSVQNNKITEVFTNKRTISDFDKVIFALPVHALDKININSENILNLPKLSYSPIVTVYVWLKNNLLENKMYNLLDAKVDWLFNHGNFIALVKSNATEFINMDKKKVIKVVFSELKKYFTILKTIDFKDYIVVKEKSATIVSNLDSIVKRNSFSNPFFNAFMIGDWVNTSLPATIETAVQSGKEISEKIIKIHN